MPRYELPEAKVPINRTVPLVLTLYEGDGATPQVLNANDVVRFKIWDDANEDPPDLDIDSEGNASANFTASGDTLTSAGHGLNDGQAVQLTTTDALPAGLSTGTTYYVRDADRSGGTFKLAATRGGSAITTGDAGTGTHTYTAGSSVTIDTVGVANTTPAKVTITVGQWDTADQTARTANGELLVVANADGLAYSYARFDVVLEASPGGSLGLD